MTKTLGGGDKEPINSHGGWRPDAGRKPSPFPVFLKKLRATEEERKTFNEFMTGDARQDFLEILAALQIRRIVKERKGE